MQLRKLKKIKLLRLAHEELGMESGLAWSRMAAVSAVSYDAPPCAPSGRLMSGARPTHGGLHTHSPSLDEIRPGHKKTQCVLLSLARSYVPRRAAKIHSPRVTTTTLANLYADFEGMLSPVGPILGLQPHDRTKWSTRKFAARFRRYGSATADYRFICTKPRSAGV
jgi:hypothetical protein